MFGKEDIARWFDDNSRQRESKDERPFRNARSSSHDSRESRWYEERSRSPRSSRWVERSRSPPRWNRSPPPRNAYDCNDRRVRDGRNDWMGNDFDQGKGFAGKGFDQGRQDHGKGRDGFDQGRNDKGKGREGFDQGRQDQGKGFDQGKGRKDQTKGFDQGNRQDQGRGCKGRNQGKDQKGKDRASKDSATGKDAGKNDRNHKGKNGKDDTRFIAEHISEWGAKGTDDAQKQDKPEEPRLWNESNDVKFERVERSAMSWALGGLVCNFGVKVKGPRKDVVEVGKGEPRVNNEGDLAARQNGPKVVAEGVISKESESLQN